VADKLDEEAKSYYASVVPADPRVLTKPMFGSLASFINGNMFAGLKGSEVFVRLSVEDRETLLAEGATDFAPMPGKAMKEYASLPAAWRGDVERTREWLDRALEWVSGMPVKEPKRKK
jgi:TfoX/Sxy family transcriptional regulator of competence genes